MEKERKGERSNCLFLIRPFIAHTILTFKSVRYFFFYQKQLEKRKKIFFFPKYDNKGDYKMPLEVISMSFT